MKLELAILDVLAKSPEGRATLDEIRRGIDMLTVSGDQRESSPSLGEIDLLQSGLVIPEGDGLQITEAGHSLLQSLETSGVPLLERYPLPTSRSLKLIDDLIGLDERLKIFDLELRAVREDTDFRPVMETPSEEIIATEASAAALEGAAYEPKDDEGTIESASESKRTTPTETPEAGLQDAPPFLKRRSFGSGIQEPNPAASRRSGLFSIVAANIEPARSYWRGHLEREVPTAKTDRHGGSAGGAVFAFLSLLVIVIIAGTVIALSQIRSLKSEIAALQRELLPLKERATRLDEAEKMNSANDQRTKAAAEKAKPSIEGSGKQAVLNLSPGEIQLIRDYIKPAPFAGTAAPAINVGDPVVGGTIPLPSPLTDKLPKLLGASFAIRNGAIIIVRRDSRQVDAVLAPN